jgi:hypothetical protein
MGNFTWFTATKEKQKGKKIKYGIKKNIYLLQPNGLEPIVEECYEGYGVFGGIDVFEWLADFNIKKEYIELAKEIGINKRNLGIFLDDYYYMDQKGNKFAYGLKGLFKDMNYFDHYEVIIENKTINELIASKVWIPKSYSELLCESKIISFPLKFSYNKNDIYEELGASILTQ